MFMQSNFILTLSCEDKPGIVAAVTTVLATIGANIVESNQFWDRPSNRFFMRVAFTGTGDLLEEHITPALAQAVERFSMSISLFDADRRPKIIVMVSKHDHVLLHLLYQIRVNWLKAEVVAIVSNHEDAGLIAERNNIRFHHLPVQQDNKVEQEEKLLQIIENSQADLVVLARYMQVLSNTLSKRLFGRVINIHHSFLPSFKGAKPYHQAYERGVKLIGATAHYVTPELDEGPIIEQETERVTHSMTSDDFIATGRDIESRVLARAVKSHLEARVVVNGRKTVVF
jgi:formyltetrahydrofolate deformylase